MKSYLTFDQVLNQDLQLNGELSEVVPRHDSIFFVETSGKNHFVLWKKLHLTIIYRLTIGIFSSNNDISKNYPPIHRLIWAIQSSRVGNNLGY